MELQRLIDRASYGPDTLRALTQAFDQAWRDIEGNFGNTSDEFEAARQRLANALLSVASEDGRESRCCGTPRCR